MGDALAAGAEVAGAATVEPGPGALDPVAGLAAVGAASAGAEPLSAGAAGAGASAPPQAVDITKTAAMTVATMNGLVLGNIDAKSS